MSNDLFDQWDILGPLDRVALQDLNDTERPPPTRTVVELVLAAAATRPAATAVRLGEEQLAYGDLVDRAAGVAAGLTAAGLRPGDVCAVLLDRRLDLYPVLLGAFLAGAVVAPLDVTAPPTRRQRGLAVVAPRLVVTSRDLAQRASDLPSRLCYEDLPRSGPVVDRSTLPAGAYAMLTSGTTGTPKPVLVGHAALANLIAGLTPLLAVDAESRLTQSAPIHFDAAWQQIFCAWTVGATLLPVPDEIRVAPPRLASWLCEQAVTHWDSVPSLWYPVVDHLRSHRGGPRPTPVVVVLAGEALHGAHVRWWLEECPTSSVFNIYGPTEVTVDATVHRCRADETAPVVPIGRPLPNLRCYVLNESLTPCPVGVAGELYLAGAGLAAGYLSHPGSTGSTFLPDPFSPRPGARMYATGDRVRLLPAGELSFEGRLDDLVKLRGVRIDLGEVETALRSAPGVTQAAVVATPDGTGLTGFICSDASASIELTYATLADLLPPAAIPRRLVRIDQIPVTAAGKTDRRRLAEWAAAPEAPDDAADVPATEAERTLLSIWAEVLGIDEVGLDDNFFGLGGDSITSIVVRDRAFEAGYRFSIVDIFSAPTVRRLAALAQPTKTGEGAGPDAVSTGRAVLPLLPEQESIYWAAAASEEQERFCVQEVYRLRGPIQPELLEAAVNDMIGRHPALRVTIELVDATVSQLVAQRPPFSLRTWSVGENQNAEAAITDALRSSVGGLRLDRWPLFDLQLIRTGPDEHALIWVMHHIFSDGWSHALLRDELFDTYVALAEGSFLPFATRPEDRYIDLIRSLAPGHRGDSDGFWRDALLHAHPARLPTTVAGTDGAGRSDQLTVTLPGAVRAGIAALARRQEVTENMVVLACVYSCVQQFTGETDITLLFVTSGRADLPQSQQTVGCFINTVPLRVRSEPGWDALTTLPRVRSALAHVRPHENTGITAVCRAAQVESLRGLSDILFLYQSYPDREAIRRISESGEHGLVLTDYRGREMAKLPLSITCYAVGEELAVDLDYWSNVYHRATIEAFAELFVEIVESAAGGVPHDD